jgi:hypothetical protein
VCAGLDYDCIGQLFVSLSYLIEPDLACSHHSALSHHLLTILQIKDELKNRDLQIKAQALSKLIYVRVEYSPWIVSRVIDVAIPAVSLSLFPTAVEHDGLRYELCVLPHHRGHVARAVRSEAHRLSRGGTGARFKYYYPGH